MSAAKFCLVWLILFLLIRQREYSVKYFMAFGTKGLAHSNNNHQYYYGKRIMSSSCQRLRLTVHDNRGWYKC